jgi:ABC-type protease/lipase transport system fused ATPase/permease subunit
MNVQIFIVIIYLLEIESDVVNVEGEILIIVVTVMQMSVTEHYFVMTVGLLTEKQHMRK